MSKWTGNKPEEEIPSRVQGKDGYYYLTDDQGNATDKIDADYYKNYLIAKKAGVNFLAYRCYINAKKIFIDKKIKIINE